MTHPPAPSRPAWRNPTRRRLGCAAVLAAVLGLWAAAPAAAPAFAQDMADCRRTAQLDETVICSEPALMEADRKLSEASWTLIGALAEFQVPWFAGWQSDWRAARARCADDNQPLDRAANLERAVACLTALYAQRQREIQWLVERADADAPGSFDPAPCEQLADAARQRPRDTLALLHGTLREAIRLLGRIEPVEPVQEQISLPQVLAREKLRDEDVRFRTPIGRGGGERFYVTDLDGDGRDDLVIEAATSALDCHRYHVFLRRPDGTLRAVRGPDFRSFEDDGSVCESNGVSVALVRAPDERVSFALMDHAFGVAPISLFRVAPDGSAPLQCRLVLGLGSGRSVVDHKQPQLPTALRTAK